MSSSNDPTPAFFFEMLGQNVTWCCPAHQWAAAHRCMANYICASIHPAPCFLCESPNTMAVLTYVPKQACSKEGEIFTMVYTLCKACVDRDGRDELIRYVVEGIMPGQQRVLH